MVSYLPHVVGVFLSLLDNDIDYFNNQFTWNFSRITHHENVSWNEIYRAYIYKQFIPKVFIRKEVYEVEL